MSKHLLAFFGLFFMMPFCGHSQNQNLFSFDNVYLHVKKIDSTGPIKPIKRSPVKAPTLSLDDHTLYFITSCDGCTLQLLNEAGDVEYSIVIPENTSTITLPSSFSGEYELQIVRGQYCFFGLIEL